MAGVISGGWEFVVAAYAVTGVVLLGYTASIIARLRALTQSAEREARSTTHE